MTNRVPQFAQRTCRPNQLHFTGKHRDTETGLDEFQARYYASMSGRWMLPDWSALPEAVPYANLGNPQTLNLYTYVGNNPITHTDVDGHILAPAQTDGLAVDAGVDSSYNGTSGAGELNQQQQLQNLNTQLAQLTQAPSAQQQTADQKLANVVYNESGSLRANPKVKPGAPGSAEDLANGRQAVAEIANRVIDAGHPNRVAPSDLKDNAAMKTDAYSKSRTAADSALNGSNISNGATQYRTRVGDNVTTPVGRSSKNPGTAVSQHYGPFIEGNHTVVIVVAQ